MKRYETTASRFRHLTVSSGQDPEATGDRIPGAASGPDRSLSINSVTITLNTPGPTSVAGTLNPGNELAAYRIDGTAGEQLQFHSVSTSSTNGIWQLIGENNQEVGRHHARHRLQGDPDGHRPLLPGAGRQYLHRDQLFLPDHGLDDLPADRLEWLRHAAERHAGQRRIHDLHLQGPRGSARLLQQPGLQRADRSRRSPTPAATPSSATTPYYSGNAGPYVLTASGTYTLTLTNTSGASGTYDFNLLSLPSAATSLALGPTQTVSGTLSTGTHHHRLQLPGAAGERIFLDNQDAYGAPVNLQLIGPDNGQIFTSRLVQLTPAPSR